MTTAYRRERIERLLGELRYEIERGMLEREIEEELNFRFVVPLSKHFKDGVVACEFRSRPLPRWEAIGWGPDGDPHGPRLQIVQGGKDA